jgi:hypothetical protein
MLLNRVPFETVPSYINTTPTPAFQVLFWRNTSLPFIYIYIYIYIYNYSLYLLTSPYLRTYLPILRNEVRWRHIRAVGSLWNHWIFIFNWKLLDAERRTLEGCHGKYISCVTTEVAFQFLIHCLAWHYFSLPMHTLLRENVCLYSTTNTFGMTAEQQDTVY